jgi:cobalt-zinc-cadmium efflux system outer membrane protein
MKKIYLVLFCSLIITTLANAQPLEQLVREVLRQNPALAAARSKWGALRERPKIVGSLPDPTLNYGYFFEPVETRVGAMNQRVGASQKIPFPGKLSLASKKARQEAMIAAWEYQTLARELILRAKTAYYDLYQVERSRDILNSELSLLDTITKTSQARYEAGEAQQPDVLRAQLATSDVQKRLLDLTQQREVALARLNALRSKPQSTRFEVASELPSLLLPDRSRAMAVALQYRQELQQAGVAIDRDQTGLSLARMDRLPDFTFGVDYTQVNRNVFSNPPDNGHDAVMGSVSVNVPIWFWKLNAEEREAARRLDQSRATAIDVRNSVQAGVQSAWFRAQLSHDQLLLYRQTLLPQAQQSFDATRAGYESAKANFIDLLDSERALLALRLGEVMTEADLARAMAQLERAVGVDLSEIKKWKGGEAK